MTPRTDKKKLLIIAFLLALITAAIYRPVLHHDFINLDDPDYVTFNEVVQRGLTGDGFKWAFTTGHAGNWHPVTWISHMLDVQMFGVKPPGHHGMNVALHVANSVLLLLLLWRLTGAIWRSTFVAALFALHPLHVESVAWVAERKDVLSTFFGLLCLMAYGKYAQTKTLDTSPYPLPDRSGEGAHRRAYVWYGVAFLLLALGLMSKPMLVTWPFVMLLLDVWPLKRAEFSTLNIQIPTLKRLALEKLPFLVLVIGSCIATFLVQQEGGAVTTMENLPLEDRLGNAVVSYAKYLFMTVWPSGLAVFYPHPELQYPKSTQWPDWAIGLTFVALFALSVLIFRHRKNQPYLLTGWLWYLGTLVPVIGFVQVGTQALADRYTYMPLIGIFVIIAWGTTASFQRLKIPTSLHPIVGTAAVITCAILTARQVRLWRDDFTLFGHTLKVTSSNAPAHSALGKAYGRRGDLEQSLEHFKAAKAADPRYSDLHNDTGVTLFLLGRYAEAVDDYLAELASNPHHLMARNNLAKAYRFMGKPQEAIEQYRLALEAQPDCPQSLHGLGLALASLGCAEEAEPHLRRASEKDPASDIAKVDLARVLASLGKFEEAEHILNNITGVGSKPEARIVLGNVLMESGRTNEAARVFRQISENFPKLAEVYLNNGKRQLTSGNSTAALGEFITALRLSPNLAEAHQNAGLLLAQSGRIAAATSHLETAIILKPDASSYYGLAVVYGAQFRHRDAINTYKKALERDPNATASLNNLAWILATHPNAELRDGRAAVEFAERACKVSDDKEPMLLGTLAAAYAEASRFEDAIRTGEQARDLAEHSGLREVASRNAQLVEQYRSRRPYRDQVEPSTK